MRRSYIVSFRHQISVSKFRGILEGSVVNQNMAKPVIIYSGWNCWECKRRSAARQWFLCGKKFGLTFSTKITLTRNKAP